jgi:hypothetical protein
LGLQLTFLTIGLLCYNKLKRVEHGLISRGTIVCFAWLYFFMFTNDEPGLLYCFVCREHDKKVCCLGLTSLIALPADKIPAEALDRIFKATLELLVAYKDQVAGAVCVCVCTALNFLNFAAVSPLPQSTHPCTLQYYTLLDYVNELVLAYYMLFPV